MDAPQWGTLRPREQVNLSGRVFMGGNEALNRLAYMVQEEKLTNLELEGCVWMYALPERLETRPLGFEPKWIRTPLPGDLFQIFRIFEMSYAGILPPDAGLPERNGVRALVPKAEDAVLFKDTIVRVKSVWWMERGLGSALWEVNVRRFGLFEVA
jgi:tartrate dehydratase beta subunit/fumarate hydratase class I family protein